MDQDLLFKYIAGEASQQENEEVAQWIDAEPKNLKEYIAMRRLYEGMIWQKGSVSITPKQKPVRSIGRELLKIAAISIAVFALSYTLLYKSDATVKMQTVYVPAGQRAQVTLADGTVVWMNSQTKLTFPDQFSDETRNVTLNGEAYFDVKKDTKKRFIVSTSHESRIEVLGTRFNIRAYKEDKDVVTTLIEGKVKFEFNAGKSTKDVELKPGQRLVYDSADKDIKLYTTTGEEDLSWKDGKIVFTETPIKEALNLLGKRYNVEFIIRADLSEDDSFTSTFTNKSLEQILDYFKVSSKMKWRYINNESTDNKEERIKIEIY